MFIFSISAAKDRNSIAVSSITADQLIRSSYATSRAPRPVSSTSLTQQALVSSLSFPGGSSNIIEVSEEDDFKPPIKSTDDGSPSGSRHSEKTMSAEGRALSHGSLNSSDDEKTTKEEKKSSQFVTAVSAVSIPDFYIFDFVNLNTI